VIEDLRRQLTRGHDHQRERLSRDHHFGGQTQSRARSGKLLVLAHQLGRNRQEVSRRFSRARLRDAEDIIAAESGRDRVALHGGWVLVAVLVDVVEDDGVQAGILVLLKY
jgi:hypothetical protein